MVFKIFNFPLIGTLPIHEIFKIGYFKNHAEHLNVVSGNNIEFLNAESYRTHGSTLL